MTDQKTLTVGKAEDAIVSLAMKATKTKVLSGGELHAILEAVQRANGPIFESFRILALHSCDCEVCCTQGTDNCDEHERLSKVNSDAVEAEYPS